MKTDVPQSPSALTPLRGASFRLLWSAWLAANIALWMNETASAWLMTSLTDSTLMVALVQTASTLPVFLLGLPSGALADIVDRRKYFAITQLWVALVALALSVLAFTNALTAPLLLALAAANGVGVAMRLPVFAAIVPAVVPRTELQSALALNGIAMNISRMIGPVIAGALLASAGSAYVFILNAVMSLVAFGLILRWRSEPKISTLPGERFFAAMRVGVQHVLQSPSMRVVLARIFLFFLQAISLLALLPLIARDLYAGGPGTFTLLLAAMSIGAVATALFLPRIRSLLDREAIVLWGTCLHAVASIIVVISPTLWVSVPAMMLAGMAWIGTANSLSLTAQLALPDWVRARGMSIYQMAVMGGMAGGAALWGYIASITSLQTSVLCAAAAGPLAVSLARYLGGTIKADEDLTPTSPSAALPEPVFDIPAEEGPVMVTIEYFIDPEQADSFKAIMLQTRRARLRLGALSWGLFRDTSEQGRYIEYFLDANWIEHLRRTERLTTADKLLRQRRLSFHLPDTPPRKRRYIA